MTSTAQRLSQQRAMLNALKLTGRKLEDIKVVTSGAGAAGIAIIKLLVSLGLKTVIMCDRNGAIYEAAAA